MDLGKLEKYTKNSALLFFFLFVLITFLFSVKINVDTSHFIYSASAQTFGAILVLGLIVIYNHMQFLDRLIKQTENRILDYMDNVIGWTYPLWRCKDGDSNSKDTVLEAHIKSEINVEGFSLTYFQHQLKRHLSHVFNDIKFDAEWRTVLNEKTLMAKIKWDNKENKVDTSGTADAIANYLISYYIQNHSNRKSHKTVKDIIIARIGEVERQKQRLIDGLEERNTIIEQLDSSIKRLKLPIGAMIVIITISFITLALQGQNADLLPFQGWENTFVVIFVIMGGVLSLLLLTINLFIFHDDYMSYLKKTDLISTKQKNKGK